MMNTLKTSENMNGRTGPMILKYTILFLIISAGVFSVFWMTGRSFMQFGDGYRQGYFWLAELKHNLEGALSGGGFLQWSWSKGFGAQYLYNLDPFDVIAACFPMKYLELGYSIALYMKLYIGGLIFLLFGRELRLPEFQIIAGSICYVFSSWFLVVTMIQGQYLFLVFMVPLLILGIERVYRGGTPLIFILAVAYFLIRNTYLSYMAAIIAIMVILLRYFAYNEKFVLKDYLANLGKFVVYALISALIAMAFMLPYVIAVFGASTDSSQAGFALFYDSSFYIRLVRNIFSIGLTNGYSLFGWTMLTVLVIPVILSRISLRNTSALMTAILYFMSLFPFFSSMFNGFSYNTGRWYVFIVFFTSWAAMEVFDFEKLKETRNLVKMSAWLVFLTLWVFGFEALGVTDISLRSTAVILMNIVCGAALLVIIGAGQKPRFTTKPRQNAAIFVIAFTLMASWSLSFYLNQDKFVKVGEVYDSLQTSTQRVAASIEDDDFYRTDQVDWINLSKEMKYPTNESLYWQSRAVYMYDSFISSKQLELNALVGNNYGYLMRVYQLSNDNRMGLDFLTGVRYFLGDDTKNNRTGADAYAGYGFAKATQIDGVNIYKNKYDAGLGYGYDKCLAKSEFLKLTRLQREQALMQAAVIEDSDINKLKGAEIITADQVQTAVSDVDFEFTGTDGVIIEDGLFTAEKDGASFTFKAGSVTNSQVIVSFDNLKKHNGKAMTITCSDGKVSEMVRRESNNQSIPNVVNFDMNMGYRDGELGEMTITFKKAGVYSYDRMYISAMDAANFDQFAEERIAEKYEIANFDNRNVSGSIDMKHDGVVFFSIPQMRNWDIYIDGEKADKITNVNIAFMGAEVSEGHHEIMLKYVNHTMPFAVAASILGLILAAAAQLLYRRNLKK